MLWVRRCDPLVSIQGLKWEPSLGAPAGSQDCKLLKDWSALADDFRTALLSADGFGLTFFSGVGLT